MKREIFVLLVILTFISMAAPLSATETGEIKGQVVDDQGIGLPGVEITAEGPRLQGTRTVISTENGSFQFPLMPVGNYTLSFRLQGFQTYVLENVIVRLGRVTDATAVLKQSPLQSEVTVTAAVPLIDKTSTDTSYYISSQDMDKMPVQNRTVVDAIKNTPGVTGIRVNTRRGTANEGQPSFRGEGEEGNNWIVDGLSISGVRLRNSGMKLNFDSIDEIQIISDPFSPEYGSSTGGIINMVTKSGGNEFSGEFSLVFSDKNLQSTKLDQLSVISEPDYFSDYNWYFNLGGPIIKDKFWFFVSNNFFTNSEETREGFIDYLPVPDGAKTIRNNNLFTKLSYALTNDHTISLTAIYDLSLGIKGGTGIPELYEDKDYSDRAVRINYKGIIDPSAYIEAGLGYVSRDSLLQPMNGNLGPAQYYIEDLARNLHNSYGNVTDDQTRFDFNLKLTKHADTDTFGHHEFNLGLEYYSFASTFAVDFTGKDQDIFPGNGFDNGTKYYFESWQSGDKTPTFFYEYGLFDFQNSSRGVGLYFKDKMTWGRVTLMAGVRTQTQICLDNNKEKMWSWGLGDFLSPRLSLSIDLTGDGINVLKLGWGKFSDLITTMPLGLLNSGAGLSFRNYRWVGMINPSEAELQDPVNWQFENEQKLQKFEIASGIEPNFLTRYLIEYDRRLGKNWAASLRFIHSNADDLLEVLAVFDPLTGYKFLYDNFEYKKRDYNGIEFELNGRIGERIHFSASYSHSSAKGTNPGQTETGSWSQEEGSTAYLGLFGNHIFIPNLPALQDIKEYYDWALGGLGGRGIGDEGWYGKLPYSVDHNAKINLIYQTQFGLSIASLFEYISGYYWEKLGYVPFFGGYYSFPEGRGTQNTPSHFYFDLGLEKEFKLSGLSFPESTALSIRIDLLNLLNSQRPISYVKENIPIYGQIWGRQQPRQVRVSIKFYF